MIPQDFIQELLNRLDIVDVVERYLPLKKAGANFTACCPFHSEKSPSFTVSPAKQFYHCFGCGAHGTAISFVMEHAGLGFVEAVNELAESVGMKVPEMRPDEARQQVSRPVSDDLFEIMRRATHYYREELKRSETAIAYLKQRGLSGEIAARFGVGYAPAGWQNLAVVFPDYQAKSLVEAGLVIEGEGGKRYDRFRDRIMFPIQNQRGLVIGFGGRVLGQGEPKYLNSPETPLFEKGHELYGLQQARQALRQAGRILVVEGYMDVVALAQHGIEYAVATLGTATTPYHTQKLLRQTDNVVFSFDGDEAGRRAAWRALENSLSHLVDGKNLSFLFLPQGEDPDSFVRKSGKEAFEALLAEALPLSQFMLRELSSRVDMRTEEGRATFLKLVKPLMEQITAPNLGLMLRKRVAEMAGITQDELDELFQIKRTRAVAKPPKAKAGRTLRYSLLHCLIQCVLAQPTRGRDIDKSLFDAGDAEGQALLALIEFAQASPDIENMTHILEHFRDTPHEPLLQRIESEIMGWNEDFDVAAEFEGSLRKLREERRNRRITELQTRLSDLPPEGKLELQ